MEMQLSNLVTALENATLMAKQLPLTSSSAATDSANIFAALHHAHRHLSLFLSHTQQPQQQPSADDVIDDDASMQLADEEQQVVDGATEEEEEISKMATIETVEERMKDCSLHNNSNKRLKRSLSPSSLAAGDQRRWLECEIESATRVQVDYDPHLRAIDLIYQFHC